MRNNPMPVDRRARVLIVDDNLSFAEKCRDILIESQLEVVGVLLDGAELAQAVADLKPDIVIIDIGIDPWSGFDLGEQVKTTRREAKTIYMTAASVFDDAEAAFRLGGAAYLSKLGFPEELLMGVRCAIRGDLYLSPTLHRITVE